MDGEYLDRSGARPAAPKRLPTAGTRIATAELNIRAGASARDRVVGELAEGSAITLTGRYGGGYAEFRHQGSLRWVSAAYLAESVGAAGPSPVATPIATPIVASRRRSAARPGGRSPSRSVGPSWVSRTCTAPRVRIAGTARVSPRRPGARPVSRIPRTTYTQVKVGQRVARSDLRLGDLVFFYGSSPSHVGLYAGNGMVLNAPRPGKTVSYSRISSMPYAGAVRPG